LYHTVVRTTGKTLLRRVILRWQGPVHAADGRDEQHPLALIPFQSFIHSVQNILLYFRSHTSWFATRGEVQNSHVHRSGHEYFSYLDIFILDTFLGTNVEPL
jgi:hypothetical protein